MRIAFLGLGRLGTALCGRLLQGGAALTVWNRTPGPESDLVAQGAVAAMSAADAVVDTDVVICCVTDGEAAHALAQSVAEALRQGTVWVDASTSGPQWTQRGQALLEPRGIDWVAAPVLGSPAAVVGGSHTVLAGGTPDARGRAQPALDLLGGQVLWVGTAVQAAALKLAVNTLGSAMIAGLGEAIALGAAWGVDVRTLVDAVGHSALSSPLVAAKGAQLVSGDFAPRVSVRVAHKDLLLIREAGDAAGLALPLMAEATRAFERALARGKGEQDIAAVCALPDV